MLYIYRVFQIKAQSDFGDSSQNFKVMIKLGLKSHVYVSISASAPIDGV